MERAKRVRDSRTQQVHIVMSRDINSVNRLFGGRLMEWIDMVGGVVAMRHCNMEIVTVAIDKLEFRAPAYIGDIVFLDGRILSVGNTSMRVQVDTYVENTRDGQRSLINHAEMVMIAIDAEQHPVRVPRLLPDPEEED